MKKLKITACFAFTLLLTIFALPLTSQAQIALTFSGGDPFFANNPLAQAAAQAAADEINAAVHFSNLNPINNDVITGVDGGVTVDFDFSTIVENPSTGLPATVANTATPTGQINVVLGAQTLTGNTLGEGGPTGTGLSAGGSVFPGGGTTVHFDHTTPSDFFTVALHELLHVLGVGTSDTWTSLVSGTNYLGANGIAANGGSGTGIIFSDGDHLAVGTQSTRISDGSIQTAVLDPALVQGTRRNLTDLDIALLQDLGFKTFPTAAIPEPSSLALLTLGGVAVCLRRRKLVL